VGQTSGRRRGGRRGSQVGFVAGGDVGLWSAWPFLLSGKAEDGAKKDAKAAPVRGGGRARAGI